MRDLIRSLMLRLLARLVLACAVVIAGYYAFRYGMAYRFALLVERCTTTDERVLLNSPSSGASHKWKVAPRVFTCVKQQQNFLDRIFFEVPDRWTDPTPPS